MSADQPTTLSAMIESEFRYLVDLGFRSLVENENSVRYDRPDGVFVSVFRDPRDKYVGFRVGLASRPRDALSATELAKLVGAPTRPGEYPERDDQVWASVARAALDLRKQGARALSGDQAIFDEAMELRRAYTQRFTRNPGASGTEGRPG
jgi:hypothetical protein